MRKVIPGLLLLVGFIAQQGLAQQAADNNFRFSLAPTSPEAAMLFKFAEIPVSKYTGIPNITIPIKSVSSSSNFSLNISLAYHPAANKVSDIPSYVGLGWSLQAGGMISRKTRGLPDDVDGGGQGFLKLRESKTYNDVAVASGTTYPNLITGCWDAEPDEFFFNVNGYSGKFSFDWSVSTDIKISSKHPVKIKYFQETPNSKAITKWQLITPDGYQYTFSTLEQTLNRSAYTGLGSCKVVNPYTTSWYVTQIQNLNSLSEYVDFTYEDYNLDYDWNYFESRRFGSGACGCPSGTGNTDVSANRSFVSGKRIRQIKLYPSVVTVDFIALNDRQDLVNTYQDFNSANKSLDEIKITYGTNQVVERHKLSYEYQGGRLMLKRIQKVSNDGKSTPPYEFFYNATSLPQRNSKQIDAWGYYNGKDNNTLLPSYINWYSNTPFLFNGADREPNEAYSKAQVLEKITYPTGGSTEFAYEGNSYSYVQNTTVASQGLYEEKALVKTVQSIGNAATGTWVTTEEVFQINEPAIGTKVLVSLSLLSASYSCIPGDNGSYFCFGGAYLPRVKIYKWNTITNQFEQIYSYTHPPSPPGSSNTIVQQVVYMPGTYKVVTEANRTGQNPANAYDIMRITLNWKEKDVTQPIVQKKAGGLRIKEIRYADAVTSLIKTTQFSYLGSNSLSTGVLNGEPRFTDAGTLNTICVYNSPQYYPTSCLYETLIGSNNIVFGETNGSHIGYREVKTYETGNGSTLAKFYSPFDFPDLVNDQKPYGYPTSNEHRTGLPYEETIYKEDGSLVAQDLYEYDFSHVDINSIKVGPGRENCINPNGVGGANSECAWDQNNYPRYYSWWVQSLRLGFSQLKKQSSLRNGLWTEKAFSYDPALQKLVLETFKNKNSSSNILSTEYKYPEDVAQITGLTPEQVMAIEALKSQNRLLSVVDQTHKKDAGILSQSRTNYKLFSTSQVNVESIAERSKANPLEVKLLKNRYDDYGNLLEQQKLNDAKYAYTWGYNHTYPIAQVVNASHTDIFHTSFEEEGEGNSNVSDSKTGRKSKIDGYTKTLTGLSNGAYQLTYWQKGGSGWVLQTLVVSVTAGTYTISLTGQVDEVRLHPESAQMTTYTYDPLVGMTSQTDMNNNSVYYEYDGFNRLSLVRDEGGNVVKKYCYNYQAQVEECGIALVGNDVQTNGFAKQCIDGGTGTSHPYTIATDAYFARTKVEANGLALAALQQQGQANANTIGTCTWTNDTQTNTFTKQCTSGGIGTTHSYTIAAGSYSSTTSKTEANQQAITALTQQGQANANTVGTCTWYNVDQSGYYTKSTCPRGQTPNPYYVSVPAGMFSSTLSLDYANQQAVQYAKSQANQYGTCSTPQVAITARNSVNSNFKVTYTNTGNGLSYTFTIAALPLGGTPTTVTLGSVPVGTYNIMISKGTRTCTFGSGCGNLSAYGTSASWTNISITSTCNPITITQ